MSTSLPLPSSSLQLDSVSREVRAHAVPVKALEMRFKGQPVQATATTIAMVATDAILTKA